MLWSIKVSGQKFTLQYYNFTENGRKKLIAVETVDFTENGSSTAKTVVVGRSVLQIPNHIHIKAQDRLLP